MIVYEFKTKELFLAAWAEIKGVDDTMKVYMPYPLEEVMEDNEHRLRPMNMMFFGGAVFGICLAMFITLVPNMITFPMNIAGKPLLSWPAFIVIGFELMILFAGLSVVGSFFLLNNYPAFDKQIFSLGEFNERNADNFFIETQKEFSGIHFDVVHRLPDLDSGM